MWKIVLIVILVIAVVGALMIVRKPPTVISGGNFLGHVATTLLSPHLRNCMVIFDRSVILGLIRDYRHIYTCFPTIIPKAMQLLNYLEQRPAGPLAMDSTDPDSEDDDLPTDSSSFLALSLMLSGPFEETKLLLNAGRGKMRDEFYTKIRLYFQNGLSPKYFRIAFTTLLLLMFRLYITMNKIKYNGETAVLISEMEKINKALNNVSYMMQNPILDSFSMLAYSYEVYGIILTTLAAFSPTTTIHGMFTDIGRNRCQPANALFINGIFTPIIVNPDYEIIDYSRISEFVPFPSAKFIDGSSMIDYNTPRHFVNYILHLAQIWCGCISSPIGKIQFTKINDGTIFTTNHRDAHPSLNLYLDIHEPFITIQMPQENRVRPTRLNYFIYAINFAAKIQDRETTLEDLPIAGFEVNSEPQYEQDSINKIINSSNEHVKVHNYYTRNPHTGSVNDAFGVYDNSLTTASILIKREQPRFAAQFVYAGASIIDRNRPDIKRTGFNNFDFPLSYFSDLQITGNVLHNVPYNYITDAILLKAKNPIVVFTINTPSTIDDEQLVERMIGAILPSITAPDVNLPQVKHHYAYQRALIGDVDYNVANGLNTNVINRNDYLELM